MMVATAQYLDVAGCDLFSGILMSISTDEGNSWSEFSVQKGLAPIESGEYVTVGCDATPMYHKKTGHITLLGDTAQYEKGAAFPTWGEDTRFTVFSIEKTTNFFK